MPARSSALLTLMLIVSAAFRPARGEAGVDRSPPNFLIIIADDCTFNDLPLYGGENIATPAIDRLAAEGMVFDRAYVSIAMCCPCRTELYTGLYPVRSGVCWNHSRAKPGVRSLVHYLGDLGYRVGLAGKNHVGGPGGVFLPEAVPGLEPNCAAQAAGFDPHGIEAFMSRDPAQPFCLIVGLVTPHAPWTVGDADRFYPPRLRLPPNLADTPVTRSEFARYLAEIEVMDAQVGRTLAALHASGREGDTLVLFTSEQGSQWPGNKWTCYDTGAHTGLVVRWPGEVAPRRRTNALVQYADVVPTLVEVAGGQLDDGRVDGISFADVLRSRGPGRREFVYMMHNNTPEGPPFPIRSVTDGVAHYVRNLTPEKLYIEKHLMGEPYWAAYWNGWMASTGPWKRRPGNEQATRLINRFMRRPAEELYLLADDPFEFNNRINDPALAATRERLSAALDAWMDDQQDPGVALDTEQAWRRSNERPAR